MKTPKKTNKEGFTLIEMLIVIVIIGLLVSIAVPAIHDSKSNSQDNTKQAITAAVEIAKNRAVIAGEAIPRQPATYAVFKKYLKVGGITPPLLNLTDKTQNKLGTNLVFWGQYPAQPGYDPYYGDSYYTMCYADGYAVNDVGISAISSEDKCYESGSDIP